MITTFEERPWDARDPHKTTFMALKHAIRLSIWWKQKETPGVENVWYRKGVKEKYVTGSR